MAPEPVTLELRRERKKGVRQMIEIYRDERRKFHVRIDGQEIERLKSFSVTVSNSRHTGATEAPSYTVEHYMRPGFDKKELTQVISRNFEDEEVITKLL